MATAFLLRTYRTDCTDGVLVIMDGNKLLFTCNVLELPDRNNQHEISCIPEGIYNVVPKLSGKFGHCFAVKDVPNRDGVLFHFGKTVKNTHGCVLVGAYNGKANVVSSKDTLKKLVAICPNGFKLHIQNSQSTDSGAEVLVPVIVQILSSLAPAVIDLVKSIFESKNGTKKELNRIIDTIFLIASQADISDNQKIILIQGLSRSSNKS